MKKAEIEVGGIYTNGKPGKSLSVRKVLDISSTGKYKLYEGQSDNDTILYEILVGPKNPNRSDNCGHTTLTSFASWAKERVPEGSEVPKKENGYV